MYDPYANPNVHNSVGIPSQSKATGSSPAMWSNEQGESFVDESFLHSVAYWDADVELGKMAAAAVATLPTPAASVSPPGASEEIPRIPSPRPVISMSTAFTSSACHGGVPPDTVLSSTDGIYFYVSRSILTHASSNNFGGLLPAKGVSPDGLPFAQTPDPADVLNVILHAVHDMPPARYTPTLATLVAALERLPAYGLSPARYATPPRALYSALLAQAPLAPLAVYTAAARSELHDLAVAVSPHLLSLPLHRVTDEQAIAMGPVYLRRLFMLHRNRIEALKEILAPAPYPHPETPSCSFADQRKVARACRGVFCYRRPSSMMESTVNSLLTEIACEDCKQMLERRLQKAVVDWTMTPRASRLAEPRQLHLKLGPPVAATKLICGCASAHICISSSLGFDAQECFDTQGFNVQAFNIVTDNMDLPGVLQG
ncbi:uncharacterized protein SCHCODRAFT_02508352 [Schizophyllum commune H4-8]|nr:uncharacterized protein SCHCODRAFT_02508352 [Schizophyllum commune H4-8]KAI5890649.1 hypothetical protein SCHCODRAFT_02508352 [Schizophyllum commune H4-8]